MGTIKLESLITDKTSGGSEVKFTIKEGARHHTLGLYGDGDSHWHPKLKVDFTDCESTEIGTVLQNIANALGHIASTVADTEGEKIVQLMKLL